MTVYDDRRFRRKVEPFDDIEIDVDLHDVLTSGPGTAPAPYVDVYPLADWIEDEWVRLRVVAPHHLIPKNQLPFIDAPQLMRHASGGDSHKRLCVLAFLYLTALGKERVNMSGNSSCSYAGGWADVSVADGSIYVECGTLNTRKPIDAMLHGETLLVLPYTLGCDKPSEETIIRLDPFPECTETYGSTSSPAWGRVQLGYIFEPKCRLRPDPFKPPLGLRPPRSEEP